MSEDSKNEKIVVADSTTPVTNEVVAVPVAPAVSSKSTRLQSKTFLLLLTIVTLLFGMILWPFYGAIFWAVVLAILFAPMHRRILKRFNGRSTWAALATLTICTVIVILPLALVTASVIRESASIYARTQSGELNFASYFDQIVHALPQWLVNLLDRFGINTIASLQARLSTAAVQGSQLIASRAVTIGQNTFEFVVSFGIMLYLLFFFLRDGGSLTRRIRSAIPLEEEHKRSLFAKFATVIRATVKGNIAVAAVQGALGGLIFWILGIQSPMLFGVLMAFLSLLPAVGAAIVWGPVAIYLAATGAMVPAIILVAFCVLVIGLVDNLLRPILVGKDTKMPDYLVLISTLGGIAIFGLNGFVIGPVIAALFLATWDIFSHSEEANEVPPSN